MESDFPSYAKFVITILENQGKQEEVIECHEFTGEAGNQRHFKTGGAK